MAYFEKKGKFPAEIHYEIFENVLPQTTLMIHGNMASTRWWQPILLELKKLYPQGGSGHLVAVDFRGCGKSSAPKSQDEVNMFLFAEDFCDLVKSLGLKSINLVGHSTGGIIAALMLRNSPELFNRAVLLDPVGAKGVKFEDSMTAAFEQMKVDRNLVALVLGSTIYQNNPDSDFFQNVVVEDAFHAAKTVGDKVLRALCPFDVSCELSAVKHPVLVLHGEFDNLLPRQDSEELAKLMANATFQQIDQQGHCCNVENPAKFANIMSKFLF